MRSGLRAGDRVLVLGRIVERSFTATRGDHKGETLRRREVIIDEIGAALRFATVQVTRNARRRAADTEETLA